MFILCKVTPSHVCFGYPSLARLVGVSDGTVAVVLAWDVEPREDVPGAEVSMAACMVYIFIYIYIHKCVFFGRGDAPHSASNVYMYVCM